MTLNWHWQPHLFEHHNLATHAPSIASSEHPSVTPSQYADEDNDDDQILQFACPFSKLHPFEWFWDKPRVCCFFRAKEGNELKTMFRHHVLGTHKDVNQSLREDDIRRINPAIFDVLKQWFSAGDGRNRWKGDKALRNWSLVFNTISSDGPVSNLSGWNVQDVRLHPNPYCTREWLAEVFLGDVEHRLRQTVYLNPVFTSETNIIMHTIEVIRENTIIAKKCIIEAFGQMRDHCQSTMQLIDLNTEQYFRELKARWSARWSAPLRSNSRERQQTNLDIHGIGLAFQQEKSSFHSPQAYGNAELLTPDDASDINQFDMELGMQQDPGHDLSFRERPDCNLNIPRLQFENVGIGSANNSFGSSECFQAQQPQQQFQQPKEIIKRSRSFSGFLPSDPFDLDQTQGPFRNSFDNTMASSFAPVEQQRRSHATNQYYAGQQHTLLQVPHHMYGRI